MTPGIILSLCFLGLSILALVLSIVVVKKRPLTLYMRACSAVYISGTVLTLLLALLRKSLPILFFVLCNLLVTTVFLFSAALLIWANKKFAEVETNAKEKETDKK